MKEEKIKEIKKLIEIYEELIKELEEKEDKKLLQQLKEKRNWLITQLNQFVGPLAKEKGNEICFFVKRNF